MWQKHADDHKAEYPLAAEAVKNSCYMDDLMPSVETVTKAKEIRQQLTELGEVKQDFISAYGSLRILKLSWTYPKLIELLNWILRSRQMQGAWIKSSR